MITPKKYINYGIMFQIHQNRNYSQGLLQFKTI